MPVLHPLPRSSMSDTTLKLSADPTPFVAKTRTPVPSLDAVTGNRVIPTPVASGEMIYAVRGMRGPLVAVRTGGDGPRGEEDIVWRLPPSLNTSRDNPDLRAQYQEIGESNRMTLLFRKRA